MMVWRSKRKVRTDIWKVPGSVVTRKGKKGREHNRATTQHCCRSTAQKHIKAKKICYHAAGRHKNHEKRRRCGVRLRNKASRKRNNCVIREQRNSMITQHCNTAKNSQCRNAWVEGCNNAKTRLSYVAMWLENSATAWWSINRLSTGVFLWQCNCMLLILCVTLPRSLRSVTALKRLNVLKAQRRKVLSALKFESAKMWKHNGTKSPKFRIAKLQEPKGFLVPGQHVILTADWVIRYWCNTSQMI